MEKMKKYIQPGISAIALLSLFVFDFVKLGSHSTLSGFTVAMNTYIGYLLIVLPFILLVAPYVPKYQKKLPKLSIVIPALCVVSWLLCVLFAKTFVSNLVNSTLAFGAWITLICYISMGVYGFLTYRAESKQIIEELRGKVNNKSK